MHPKGSINIRDMCRLAREEKQRHLENEKTKNQKGSKKGSNVVTSQPETLSDPVFAVGDQESSSSSAASSKRADSGQAKGLQDSGSAPSNRPSKKLKKDPK